MKRCRQWPAMSILLTLSLCAGIYFLLYRFVLLHVIKHPRHYIPFSPDQASREIWNSVRLVRPAKTSISVNRAGQTDSSLISTEKEELRNLTKLAPFLKKVSGFVRNVVKEKVGNATLKHEFDGASFGAKRFEIPEFPDKNGTRQVKVQKAHLPVKVLNTSMQTSEKEGKTQARGQSTWQPELSRTSKEWPSKSRSSTVTHESLTELKINKTKQASLSVPVAINFTSRIQRKQRRKNYAKTYFSKFNFDRNPRKKSEFAVTLSPTSLIIENPHLCSDIKETLWVILVHTAVSHFSQRQAIRDTWANKYTFRNISLKLVFLVGTTPNSPTSKKIVTESDQYGDIVQGNFLDTYRNLSTKGIMGFLWIATYCPMADLIIKVDDDVYLNMYKVVHKVFPRLQHRKRHMLCELNAGFPIQRSPSNLWYVPKEEFPQFKRYPSFCRGPAVFITPDLILPLLNAARKVPLFWIDDVYLFGMLPFEATGVKFLDFKANCSNVEKLCLKQYESDLPTNLAVCKSTSKDTMYRMWRHGWRRLPENGRHLLSVNFLPAVDNFIRNFPKIEKYKFPEKSPPKTRV